MAKADDLRVARAKLHEARQAVRAAQERLEAEAGTADEVAAARGGVAEAMKVYRALQEGGGDA